MLIQYRMSSTALNNYVDVQDGSAVTPRVRIHLWGETTNAPISNLFLDFSSCPRRFDSNIVLYFPSGLTNLEFVHIELFGFEENRS